MRIFRISRILFYLFLSVLLIRLVDAAVISGSVYDLTLNKASNVIVTINTSTRQLAVLKNGSYSFNVPNGVYSIKAQLMEKNAEIASAQENVTIVQDGAYVIDIILYPDFRELEDAIETITNGDSDGKDNKNYVFIVSVTLLVIMIAIIAGLVGLLYSKKAEAILQKSREVKKEDAKEGYSDIAQLINFIKQEGGRTTQKEIRKQIPLSEAKISLMLAELEHKNIIEKIKKGRGNIIILKKNEI